jgi:anti-sigma28 factor (negative regulator of flagellin synthesis)
MRIDDLNRASVTQGTEQAGQTAHERTQGKDSLEKGGVASADQADVSHLAQSLAAPDPGRVEQLRLQVESGNYDVSARALANSLINAHLKA